jgi:hypothetical protein
VSESTESAGAPPVAAESEIGRIPSGASRVTALLFGRGYDLKYASVVLLVGCLVLAAGLQVVAASSDRAFTYGGALDGILSQLGVTGPAAILIGLATAANVLLGAIVLRLTATAPFRCVSDLVLAGFAGAVVVDAAALFLLGSIGFFGWPELMLLHLAAFAAYAAARRRRPGWSLLDHPIGVQLRRPLAWWPLVLAIWAGPLIVQLASPAVPFMDVLPNHVAPVEHVRVFGDFATLITSPSPIYGPSRLMLGYVATLGQLTTITNLDAVLAEAAFATPLAILVALSLRRLAGSMFGGSASFWILLTFPLSFTFLRIPDSRGTVVAFPLALWAMACLAEELRVIAEWRPAPPFRPDLALTFALGGAILLHPLIGLFAYVSAAGVLALYPIQLGPRLIPALGGAAVIAIPQALTMGAVEAPAWVGFVALAAGVGVAFGLAWAIAFTVRALGRTGIAGILFDWSFDTADTAGVLRVALVSIGIAAMLRIAQTHFDLPDDYPIAQIEVFGRLVALCLFGAVIAVLRPQRGWVLLGCAIGAGAAAWAAASLFGVVSLTQQAVHYEVPKTVEYWLPAMLALGGAAGISALWRLRWLGLVRPIAVLLFLVVSIYPVTSPVDLGPVHLKTSVVEAPLVDSLQIGEHRGAESLGTALREAERGYWDFFGYPDTRTIINAPRQAVVDEIRSLESSGRIGPSTVVLHIASDFQQWTSVPIGVFTGAMETSISFDPLTNIHTEGGRLLGVDQLAAQLAARPGCIVLEPQNMNPTVLAAIERQIDSAGYQQIWANLQATIYEPA